MGVLMSVSGSRLISGVTELFPGCNEPQAWPQGSRGAAFLLLGMHMGWVLPPC